MTVEELIAKQTRIERCVPALRRCDILCTKQKSQRVVVRAGRRRRTARRCPLSGMRPTRSSATWLAPSISASSAAACCMAAWARAAMCAWMRSMSRRRCRPWSTLQCRSISTLQMQGGYSACRSQNLAPQHVARHMVVVMSWLPVAKRPCMQGQGRQRPAEVADGVPTSCCARRRAVRTVCSWSGALNRSSAPTSLQSAWGANLRLLTQTAAYTDHAPMTGVGMSWHLKLHVVMRRHWAPCLRSLRTASEPLQPCHACARPHVLGILLGILCRASFLRRFVEAYQPPIGKPWVCAPTPWEEVVPWRR